MNTPEKRATVNAMLTLGGGFASHLGKALLNTDGGAQCLIELATCLKSADEGNRAAICRLLAQANRILSANQTDRFDLIVEDFQDTWDCFRDVAAVA